MHAAAGNPDPADKDSAYDAGDLANSAKEYDAIDATLNSKDFTPPPLVLPHGGRFPQGELQRFLLSVPEADRVKAKVWVIQKGVLRPAGAMTDLAVEPAAAPTPSCW